MCASKLSGKRDKILGVPYSGLAFHPEGVAILMPLRAAETGVLLFTLRNHVVHIIPGLEFT